MCVNWNGQWSSVRQGRIMASAGPGAVLKMRAPLLMGTNFCFYRAYCIYQKSAVAD